MSIFLTDVGNDLPEGFDCPSNFLFLFGDIGVDMANMLLDAGMTYHDVRKARLEKENLLRGLADTLRKKFKKLSSPDCKQLCLCIKNYFPDDSTTT